MKTNFLSHSIAMPELDELVQEVKFHHVSKPESSYSQNVNKCKVNRTIPAFVLLPNMYKPEQSQTGHLLQN